MSDESACPAPAPTPKHWPRFRDDYPFTMSGAHRKPAYEIGAPSITWHTGFWIPSDDASDPRVQSIKAGGVKNEILPKSRYDLWIEDIEELILHTYNKLLVCKANSGWKTPSISNLQPLAGPQSDQIELLRRKISPVRGADGEIERYQLPDKECAGNEGLPTTWYETVHIDATWESMPLDIRFEVTDEYFTITTTIDFSRIKTQPGKRRGKGPREFDADLSKQYRLAREHFSRLIEITNERRLSTRGEPLEKISMDRDITKLRDHSQFLFYTLWESLKDLYGENEKDPTCLYVKRLGECFIDLRNISLRCLEGGPAAGSDIWSRLIGSFSKGAEPRVVSSWNRVNGELFEDSSDIERRQELRKTIVGHAFDKDDLEWVNAIHPILLAAEPEPVNKATQASGGAFLASDPVEYCFTKFFRERSIYGSGFGPQIGGKKGDGDPLTYVTLFGYDEPRQMGRLIYLLQTLASYRLAALHELQGIKLTYDRARGAIESELSQIEDLLDDAFKDTYPTASRETKGSGKGFDKHRKKELLGLFASVRVNLRTMDDLDQDSRMESRDAGRGLRVSSHDWMPQRSWRLNYYRERFERLAKALAAKNIEGFQAYDDFIEHRLGRAYYTIRLVLDHFAQLRAKEGRLRAEWMSIQADRKQDEIERIQKIGEFFFFIVLCTYYLSHITLLLSKTEITAVHDGSVDALLYWIHLRIVIGCLGLFLLVYGAINVEFFTKKISAWRASRSKSESGRS